METSQTSRRHWLAGRLPFFYGWVIVPISVVTLLATSPGQTFLVSVFNPYFRETFKLSLSQLSAAYMGGTLLAAIPQPFLGTLMDKWGIRRLTLISLLMLGLTCLFTAQTRNLFMLFLAFFFLRTFGQGALTLLSSNMLAMWFRTRLGTVSGITGVLNYVFVGVFPVGVLAIITQMGWQNTYAVIGLVLWALVLPLVVLFYINRPEEIGQHVDGTAAAVADGEETTANGMPSLDLRAAIRTRAYWIMLVISLAWGLVATAFIFNMISILTARGLSETQAAVTFTAVSAVTAVLQLGGGYLADRLRLNWLASISLLLYVGAMLAVLYAPLGIMTVAYALLLGTAQAFFTGVNNTVWPRYYGRRHLGKIRSSVWMATVAGSSLGPFLMGLAYDNLGDYRLSLIGIVVLMSGLAVAGVWATPPEASQAEPFVN